MLMALDKSHNSPIMALGLDECEQCEFQIVK